MTHPNWVEQLDSVDPDLLEKAHREVAWLISGAVYTPGPDGWPIGAQDDACKDAVKAQAAWLARGGPTEHRSFSIGSVTVGPSTAAARTVSADAHRILAAAGLTWQVVA